MFPNNIIPIYNASGCWCTNKEELDELKLSSSAAILTKSSTLTQRSGNELPRLAFDNYGSINSMGVPNFGYKYYFEYYINNIFDKPYIQSIMPFSLDELIIMLDDINKNILNTNHKYYIEINLSCPNIIGKSIICYDFNEFEHYLKTLEEKKYYLILGLKLPPYYMSSDFDIIANIILKYKCIKFITCVNSIINGLLIDAKNETTLIHPKNGLGGIGGIYCKPVTLANVYNFYKRLNDKIQIIGCGGVSSGQDIFDLILAGASGVQIGTELIKSGIGVFDKLRTELLDIMKIKKYNHIDDFKGKLKIINNENK